MKTLFYLCPYCGNVVIKLVDSGVVPSCCGHSMQLLSAQTSDPIYPKEELLEKHVPSVHRTGECTLRAEIGSQPHPMSPDHHIQFICLESEQGVQIRFLTPDKKATASFYCGHDRPSTLYAFCNLHGLWANEDLPTMQSLRSCSVH